MQIGRSIAVKTALVTLLSASIVIPVLAAEPAGKGAVPTAAQTAAKEKKQPVIPSVKINNQSEMTIRQLHMMPGTDHKIVSFILSVKNNGTQDLDFIDYWVRLKNDIGTEYDLNYLTDDINQDKIPAKSTKEFQFYAEVDSDVEYGDLVFDFIEWDFNAPNYERRLGTVSIPDKYSPVVKAKQKSALHLNGYNYQIATDKLSMRTSDEAQVVQLDLTVENAGSRTAPVPDVQYALLTPDNLIYIMQKDDTSTTQLSPRVEADLSLTAALPCDINLNEVRLLIFSKQEEVIELPLALYELPKASVQGDQHVDLGESLMLDLSQTQVDMSVVEYRLEEQDNQLNALVKVRYENTGSYSGNIPNYEYALHFESSGTVYPLKPEGDSSAFLLHPKLQRDVTYSVNIPLEYIDEPAEMSVTPVAKTDEDGNPLPNQILYSIGVFEVPSPSSTQVSDSYQAGKPFRYETTDGVYNVILQNMQRMPWEEYDIISAEMVVSNPGTSVMPIPSFDGTTFQLDGVRLSQTETKLIRPDRVLGIAPGSEVRLVYYAKIPYTYQYTSSGVVLSKGNSEDGTATELAQFQTKQLDNGLPVVAADDVYDIHYIGNRAEMKVRNMLTFESEESNVVVVEAELENLETRKSSLPALTAYLKTTDDVYFELQPSDYTAAKVNPGRKALITFTATVSERYALEDMSLIVGEKVADEDPANQAYLNAVAMELPEGTTETKSSLNDLSVFPYSLSISDVKAVMEDKAWIDIEYDLVKEDNQFEVVPGGQKIVIEFVDGEAEQEWEFDLGTSLELGEHDEQLSFNISVNELVNLLGAEFDSFELNVYAEYNGHRTLLGSDTYKWFN